MLTRFLFILLVAVYCTAVNSSTFGKDIGHVPIYGYEIVNIFPHDPHAFTQGLAYNDEYLWEGTGLYGQSYIARRPVADESAKLHRLPNHLFGEGITVLKNQVYQLTWKSKTAIVRDKKTLNITGSFTYPTEGWGLTNDGHFLIMSDGSSMLYFLDPELRNLHHSLEVTADGMPVSCLNELEYIKGEIWANIFKKNYIARINPENGAVIGWIDLTQLSAMASPGGRDNVLNGIAYDMERDRIFITGKRWPQLFEIKVKKMNLPRPPDTQ